MSDHSGDYVTATMRARDEAARELYDAAIQAEQRQSAGSLLEVVAGTDCKPGLAMRTGSTE